MRMAEDEVDKNFVTSSKDVIASITQLVHNPLATNKLNGSDQIFHFVDIILSKWFPRNYIINIQRVQQHNRHCVWHELSYSNE